MEQRPIASLKNLGPSTARDLAQVGIETEAQFREIGAVDAWRRLNSARPNSYTLAGLYALAGALQDVVWTDLPVAFREELRAAAFRRARPAPKRSREPAGGSRRQSRARSSAA